VVRQPRAGPARLLPVLNTLTADPSPGVPVPPILPLCEGFLFLDREKFAADLPRHEADSRVRWSVGAVEGAITDPAWRCKRMVRAVTA
jgi:hypothetical protein